MTIAIIPARGGSVRIPRKNLRPFHGKPIIAYAIDTARDCGLFTGGIYVSTEDAEIAAFAHQQPGVFVVDRPPELAEVDAPDYGTQEVTRHALWTLQVPHHVAACCIYPCTPLMTPEDLVRGFALLGAPPAAFVYPQAKAEIGFQFRAAYDDPGQFYWGWTWAFIGRLRLTDVFTRRLLIDSARCLDINTEDDWTAAERLYAAIHKAQS